MGHIFIHVIKDYKDLITASMGSGLALGNAEAITRYDVACLSMHLAPCYMIICAACITVMQSTMHSLLVCQSSERYHSAIVRPHIKC